VRSLSIVALLLFSFAAALPQESRVHAVFRGEGTRFQQSCREFSLKVSKQSQVARISFLPTIHCMGLTLRAGGLPALSLTFARAGPEGVHTIATVNTSLLGGSARPSLF
jgi:hypothetical protein